MKNKYFLCALVSAFFVCGCDNNSEKLEEESGASVCGDGVIVGEKECDDGNNASEDGCSSECKIEDTCVFSEFSGDEGWNQEDSNPLNSRIICENNERVWCERKSGMHTHGVLRREACGDGTFCFQGDCYKNPEGESCESGFSGCYKNKLVECVGGEKKVTECAEGTFCIQPKTYRDELLYARPFCSVPCSEELAIENRCVVDTLNGDDILLEHVCYKIDHANCSEKLLNNSHVCDEWAFGYTEKLWVPQYYRFFNSEICEYGCFETECLEPVTCSESKCSEDGHLMTCNNGYYQKTFCEIGESCQTIPEESFEHLQCYELYDVLFRGKESNCPGYSGSGTWDSGIDCYEQCPLNQEKSSVCTDDTHLEVYECALVDGVYYQKAHFSYECSHGCKDGACIVYSEEEGKPCPDAYASKCDGDVRAYCQLGRMNGENYQIWAITNCLELNRKCISGVDTRGDSVGYCGTGEACYKLNDERSTCYNSKEFNIPNWNMETITFREQCENIDGKLQWVIRSIDYCIPDYQCLNGACVPR